MILDLSFKINKKNNLNHILQVLEIYLRYRKFIVNI